MFRRFQLTSRFQSNSCLLLLTTTTNSINNNNTNLNFSRRFQTETATAATTTSPETQPASAPPKRKTIVTKPSSSINNVTLTGVIHDVQVGYVFETRVTQFVLTTTSIDTTHYNNGSNSGNNNASNNTDCVVEKDHHTIRCFGEPFADDIAARIKEGSVVCCNGRLRLNPQLEQSCGKHFYFPYVHIEPPFGSVAIVHGDHRRPPKMVATQQQQQQGGIGDDSTSSGGGSSSIPVAAAASTSATATTTTSANTPSEESN
jgi:hypothetical protein